MGISQERLEIIEKIKELEKNRDFLKDVENDPPFHYLKSGEVDYKRKKLSSKIKAKIADFYSFRFFNHKIKKNEIIIDSYEGLENLKGLKSGAVITQNHFSPFDSIPLHKVCKKYQRKRQLYKVIKEGNYSYPGLFGFFMRNCYTMPLARDTKVLKEMIEGVEYILKKGCFLLVYPEQSMWWNYRKPKPYQIGAFNFASRCNVPILPCFITMRDTELIDKDGLNVQAYTLHILKPIYPKAELSVKENMLYMKEENERVVKELYEKVYGKALSYDED